MDSLHGHCHLMNAPGHHHTTICTPWFSAVCRQSLNQLVALPALQPDTVSHQAMSGNITCPSPPPPHPHPPSQDTRSERNRSQIISQGQYAAIQNLVGVMPPSVKHLVVTSSVPLIYPAGAASDPILAVSDWVGLTGRGELDWRWLSIWWGRGGLGWWAGGWAVGWVDTSPH